MKKSKFIFLAFVSALTACESERDWENTGEPGPIITYNPPYYPYWLYYNNCRPYYYTNRPIIYAPHVITYSQRSGFGSSGGRGSGS
jgi:hypothetical protein